MLEDYEPKKGDIILIKAKVRWDEILEPGEQKSEYVHLTSVEKDYQNFTASRHDIVALVHHHFEVNDAVMAENRPATIIAIDEPMAWVKFQNDERYTIDMADLCHVEPVIKSEEKAA